MDVWHLIVIVGVIVLGVLFGVIKVLTSRSDRFRQHVDRKEVMEYYNKKIAEIREKKAKQ